jgi:hypothetical protein
MMMMMVVVAAAAVVVVVVVVVVAAAIRISEGESEWCVTKMNGPAPIVRFQR